MSLVSSNESNVEDTSTAMYENVEALASIGVWIERNAVSLFPAALDEVFKILLVRQSVFC